MYSTQFLKIPKNLLGKVALVRVDFNEPLKNGKVSDSFRITQTIPTIQELLRRGACLVILAHLEDPITKKQLSTRPLARVLEGMLGGTRVSFVSEYSRSAIDRALEKNKIVFLENVRFQEGETKNDLAFARLLSTFGDIYINDAFSASHRTHASIVGVTRFLPSYAGLLLEREVRALGLALTPAHPFLLIVGGAKFETKFALMKNFLPKADAIFLGGALANAFLVAEDISIGASLYEKDVLPMIKKHFLKSKKIMLPFDVRVSHKTEKSVFEVEAKEHIFDVGPETIKRLSELARASKYVLWNGPLGYIEKGYDQGTRDLLGALSRMPKVKVILGGGDTLSVLDHENLHKKFYHVSTGGGAMLDFLSDGTLPGIKALTKKRSAKK